MKVHEPAQSLIHTTVKTHRTSSYLVATTTCGQTLPDAVKVPTGLKVRVSCLRCSGASA